MTDSPKAFHKIIPEWKDINFGIILISVYYILDLGSVQGLFPVISYLEVPFIVSAVSVGYAFIIFLSGKLEWKSGVTRSLFFLLLFTIFYSLVSTKNPNAKEQLIKLCIIYFSNYIIFVSKVKKISQFIFLLDIFLLAVAFSSYNGIFQGGLVWGSRWFNDENQLSLLVDIAFPFAIVMLVLHKSKIKKLYYLFCIFNYTILNVIAHSRGGSLGLIIAILLCIIVMKNKLRNFVFMLMLVLITLHYAPPIFFEDMGTLEQGTQEETADDRLYLWGIAFEMFIDHPLFGVGPMNYPYYFSQYEKGVRYTSHAQRVSHSTPLENLAETGLAGVLFFLLLQIELYKNWKCLMNVKSDVGKRASSDKLNAIHLISHSCAISQIVFHWCSLFLTLFMFPFYWSLLPFSEAWKEINSK